MNRFDLELAAMAAGPFEEMGPDGAIDLLKAALLTEERADTHRYLSLAYVRTGDYDRALAEITEAITLDPSSPENYHVRSLLRRIKGDHIRAASDLRRCTMIDPNYRNVEAIRQGAEAMKSHISDRRLLDWCRSVTTSHPVLRPILDEVSREAEEGHAFFDRPACALPCPAYCCYFEYDMCDHEVIIGQEHLVPLRVFLTEQGLKEEVYIARSRRKISHKGLRDRVFYPRRSRRPLDRTLLAAVPRNLGYSRIIWAPEKARACTFLTPEGCMIHKVGERPGLDACRDFMCLTGIVFLVLRYLGLYREEMVEGKGMAELNDLAARTLLLLSGRLFTNRRLKDCEASFHGALMRAVESAERGDSSKLPTEMAVCLRHRRAMEKRRVQAMQGLEKDLGRLFPVSGSKDAVFPEAEAGPFSHVK